MFILVIIVSINDFDIQESEAEGAYCAQEDVCYSEESIFNSVQNNFFRAFVLCLLSSFCFSHSIFCLISSITH
jgi:hypothetical protein